MGELRLYAVGIEELRGVFGAPAALADQLRNLAQAAYAPAAATTATGLLGKLGPIFRRVPATAVRSPTQPEPHDLEVLLAGAYVHPERVGATWRLLETLAQGLSWGSTQVILQTHEIDELDFALARAGVSAAVGLRHLLNNKPALPLAPAPGLTVGWHPHERAVATAGAFHSAAAAIAENHQRETTETLAAWLDGFTPWARVASTLDRPAPDLIAFFAD